MMSIRRRMAILGSSQRESRRRKARLSYAAGLETLETRQLLAAAVSLLRDSLPAPPYAVIGTSTTVAELDGWVYFSAVGAEGNELWRTDGTSINTKLFADLRPGSESSQPGNFQVANGKLFFTASTNGTTLGLFVTDGTPSGTTMLTGTEVGAPIGVLGEDSLYYRPGVRSNNGQFWKSDGTVAGTVMFSVGVPEAGLIETEVFDDTLFYTFPIGFTALWKVDTETGIKTQVAGRPEDVKEMTVSNGSLFFSGLNNGTRHLWKLDSATSTPTKVQAIDSPSIALAPQNLRAANGKLYFSGATNANGFELWQSDGTSAGTSMVEDINPGSASSFPQNMTVVNDSLFFTADDGVHGVELWKSDGLESNTALVEDIIGGSVGAAPAALFNLNGLLVFFARTQSSPDIVLWTSDGTETGTVPVGTTPTNLPDGFAPLGSGLLFAAQNSTTPRSLFVLSFGEQPSAPVITGPTAVTSSLRPTVTWNAVGTATEYEIWIKNESIDEDRLIIQPVSGTAFTPSNDLGIGNYTVWVRTAGTTSAPPSLWSAPYNFRIKAAVTQNPVGHNSSNGLPTISWLPLPGAVKYDVWIDRLDVPTSQIFRDTNVTGTSVTPPSLPNNGKYRVWLRGLAVDGTDGAWSASQDYVAVQVPAITGGLNPTFDTSPTVTWTAVPGAASYEVYVLSINGNFKALHQKNIAGTTFTWPTLPAGPYRYWVRATGATIWSNPVDIDTTGRTDVLTPTGTTSDNPATFTWRPVDGAVRYELWVDQQNPWVQKVVYQTNLTSTSFVSGMPLGTFRTWVRAVSATNQISPWSAYVDFTIVGATLPLTPSTDSDLLASVFSDPQLLPALGESPSLPSDPAAQTPSVNPNAPPEDPDRLSKRMMTAFRSVAVPTSEGLVV